MNRKRWILVGVATLAGVLLGLSRTQFAVEESLEIEAPPEVVWSVLMDGPRYKEWNSQLAWLGGPATLGETLHLKLSVEGVTPYEFKPAVTALEPNRRFTWLAQTGLPRIFDGEHSFTLEPSPSGGTRLKNREEYRGILSPFLENLAMMKAAPQGFRKMNEDLRQRALSLKKGTP